MSARGADISIRKDERGKGEMKKRERERRKRLSIESDRN